MKLKDHFAKRYTFFLCTKNRRALLAENLERFRDLKGPNDELIVIDGGSTDGTAELLDQSSDLVDCYVSEPDTSEGEALNKALLLARGKYLKVLSDDDIFHRGPIEQACEVMETHPEIDLLVCGGTVERQSTNVVLERCVPPGTNYGKSPGDVFDHYGNGLGLVIRHASLCRIGLFSPTAFSLDWDYITHVIASGACVRFCRLNVCHHVIFDHSTSVAKRERLLKDQARIARLHGRPDVAAMRDPRGRLETLMGIYYSYRKQLFARAVARIRRRPLRPKPALWDGGLS